MPPQMECPNLDIFLKMIPEEIEKLGESPPMIRKNLTDDKVRALLHLEKDKTLIFKPSDKGKNLVVMNHPMYKKMAYDLLLEIGEESYGVLERDLLKQELE